MTIENAIKLIQKAKKDKELTDKLKAAGKEGFAAVAAEAGLPCEVAHVAAARKAAKERATDALGDGELDAVSGGSGGDGNDTLFGGDGDDTLVGGDW
jgi:predicted ribosomally synthesized peptide with nif11-like leader